MGKPVIHHNPMYELLRAEQVAEFNRRKAAGEPIGDSLRAGDFRGLDLRELDANGLDLRDAYFRGADLRGIDFRNTQLEGASFAKLIFLDVFFRLHCVRMKSDCPLIWVFELDTPFDSKN